MVLVVLQSLNKMPLNVIVKELDMGKGTGAPELTKITKEIGILTINSMQFLSCERNEVYNNAYSSLEKFKEF